MTEPRTDRTGGSAIPDLASNREPHAGRSGLSALWALSMGWELVVPIAAGALAGHLLDQRYHTGAAVTASLLILGVLVGWYNVVRLIRLVAQHERGRVRGKRDGTS